jgi:hypothetical protein
VVSGLQQVMEIAIQETLETAKQLGVSLRIAAYVNSINRLDKFYTRLA